MSRVKQREEDENGNRQIGGLIFKATGQ
jgi:hypothetical protein